MFCDIGNLKNFLVWNTRQLPLDALDNRVTLQTNYSNAAKTAGLEYGTIYRDMFMITIRPGPEVYDRWVVSDN